jgi:hypothetical protein
MQGKFLGNSKILEWSPMKTGTNWKTLVLKLYSFPKWRKLGAARFVPVGES